MVPQKWTHTQTDRQTDRRTDISTYRKHWPRGPMLWKSCIQETKNLSTDANRRTDTIFGRLHDLSFKKKNIYIHIGCMIFVKKITSRNDLHFLMYIFIFRVLMPLWRTAGTDAIVKAGIWSCDPRANERPQKKIIWKGTEPAINGLYATLWKNQP